MSSQYILAIDQGTTGTKVLVTDLNLKVVAESSHAFEQHFPEPGYVEHDLNQIWESVQKGIHDVLQKVESKKIIALGITNQRETIGFWEKGTLKPLRKAMVWQDRRTSARCKNLKDQNLESDLQKTTGLLLDPYFSATKIEWAIQNDSNVQKALQNKTLQVGTIDCFLLAKLTGGRVHATEPSNASRTLLMDLKTHQWDLNLLKLFSIPEFILPKILPTFGEFGKTVEGLGLPSGIPITGIIGDQQSALLGQAAIEVGQAKCTYGTGAFLLMNTGHEIKLSQSRLLTTVAWMMPDGQITYALEGSAFMAGATIQWLRDGLKMIQSSSEVEALASKVPSSEGVFFVPAFTGLGAPYWQPDAKAIIGGLTRGSTQAHIARAALEGIALQNVDILKAMEKDLGQPMQTLNVDGGACKNNLLMQIQSDLLGVKLNRPQLVETTSLGAVFAAGVGAKIWLTLHEVKKTWKLEQEFSPRIEKKERDQRYQSWIQQVSLTKA